MPNNDYVIPPGFSLATFDVEGFTEESFEDEELVLVQLPHDFQIEKLNGKEIELNGIIKNPFQNNKSYKSTFTEQVPKEMSDYHVLIPTKEPGKLIPINKKITGHMMITETFEIPEIEYPEVVEKKIPFPENLKERFVPFGSGPYMKSPTKKRKIKKEETDEFPQFEESPSKKKKKHKKSRKNDDDLENETSQIYTQSKDESQTDDSLEKSPSKKKKHKKSNKQEDDRETETSKIYTQLKEESQTDDSSEKSPSKKKKKHKKSKKQEDDSDTQTSQIYTHSKDESQTIEGVEESPSKKKKHKKTKKAGKGSC